MQEIVIYTTPTCPFCVRAKALLDHLKLPYQEISVQGDPSARATMEKLSGRHMVPQIFIGGEAMGGCDDLMALHASGQLLALVR